MEHLHNNTLAIFYTLFCISILINHATSFDITKMLSQQSDFSSFSNLLTQTQVASQINSRQTITVLALDNTAVSKISSKPTDVVKKILQVHVVLDYYDPQKLQKLSDKTALLTTLFQASGSANGQQGFVNVTVSDSGTVSFGSAVSSSSLDSSLVKSVVSQPYNISVLQISSAIVPPGVDGGSKSSGGGAPASSPGTGGATAPPPKSSVVTPSPSTGAPPRKSRTPSPSSAPSSGGDASPPTSADAPTSDGTTGTGTSPTSAPVGSPLADGPVAADGPGPAAGSPADKSDGGRIGGGVGILVSTVLFVGLLV